MVSVKYMQNKMSIGNQNKNKIIKMREHGKSLHQIGRAVGLTGERIRQLERVWGIEARGYRRKTRISRLCSNQKCLKPMSLLPSDKRQNCCKKCYMASFPKKTIAEKRRIWREKHIRYYHNVMKKRKNFKAYVKSCNDKYQKNKKK